MIWFEFVLCLGIILFAGTKLAQYGDAIAEKTKLGRIWIGLALISAITTMPELVTSVSSVALVGSPDLALGTLVGSCCFNLSILALLDIIHRRTPVLSVASPRHIVAAGWGGLLIAITSAGILGGDKFSFSGLGWVGIPSVVIFALYLVGMWCIFQRERNRHPQASTVSSGQYDKFSMRTVCFRFALAAGAIIGAGIWLSFVGDQISEMTGWGRTFVGSLFLAITTSAPELVVANTAARIGAVDLAVGNILGANMLDIAMIFPVDLAHGQGFVLSAVSEGHLVVGFVAIVMSLVVMAGLRFRQKHKVFKLASWYSPVLIGLYIFGAYVLFKLGVGS